MGKEATKDEQFLVSRKKNGFVNVDICSCWMDTWYYALTLLAGELLDHNTKKYETAGLGSRAWSRHFQEGNKMYHTFHK